MAHARSQWALPRSQWALLGEPQAWPPNKLKEKKCIGSTLPTDQINLKSKGFLPPGAFPTPAPVPPRPGTGPKADYYIRNVSAWSVSLFPGTSLGDACSSSSSV